ncbi:hypothetical protein NQ318_007580 [Aromia moschata]|uniref:Equilibrative nucleoside transporter 3 n=1 Tax=Aromia moschata TaxID=1265417 RepID=A0AAV8YC79_9CUCU|nr:hypothetical protein NQ318_007580 [Aromia moschata]
MQISHAECGDSVVFYVSSMRVDGLVSVYHYWMYKFRNVSLDEFNITSSATPKTDLQARFSTTYSIVANVCSVVSIVLTVLLYKRVSLQTKIIGSLVVMIILLVITLVFVWTNTDAWQDTFFIISLVIAGLLSGSGLCFTVSVFQFSVKFPPVYLGSMLSGQSVCGIVVSLVQIFTLAVGTSSQITAFIFFSIGVAFILGVQILFSLVMAKDKYMRDCLAIDDMVEHEISVDKSRIVEIFKKIIPIILTMLLTAGSTIIIHPGLSSLAESIGKGNGRWNDVFFVPVCTFLFFNLFDFFGRESSLRWNWLGGTHVVLVTSVLRLILVPMIMFCNIQPRHHLPVVFDEDYAYGIFMIVFAFSAGYLTNLCLRLLQSVVQGGEMKIAMFITMMVMIIGMITCSFLSGVMRSLL